MNEYMRNDIADILLAKSMLNVARDNWLNSTNDYENYVYACLNINGANKIIKMARWLKSGLYDEIKGSEK